MQEGLNLRIELGIDARRYIQMVQADNDVIEQQILKGLTEAFAELSEGDSLSNGIKEQTKKAILYQFSEGFISYDLRRKVKEMIDAKVESLVTDYADKLAAELSTAIDQIIKK